MMLTMDRCDILKSGIELKIIYSDNFLVVRVILDSGATSSLIHKDLLKFFKNVVKIKVNER